SKFDARLDQVRSSVEVVLSTKEFSQPLVFLSLDLLSSFLRGDAGFEAREGSTGGRLMDLARRLDRFGPGRAEGRQFGFELMHIPRIQFRPLFGGRNPGEALRILHVSDAFIGDLG